MELDITTEAGLGTVTVANARIDAAVAIQFKDQMRELTRDAPDRIILNLSQVEFIDSSGLGAIVAVMKSLRDGQRMELAALSPAVDKVFRMTRMDSIFVIHASADAAHNA
ncbi:STAS domain-containing protein [Thalassococcus sp. CAU 1522]|uniref:STAS domain-containing protein n=1 Tax=Thalassococcus arenae TaxID=2851652 RepID=A0ABS6N820_9RHOB|nr:STAS domain-containing protein [Thalassococcus arenae]MBV2360166.1 STAS domain-containing protein [Thalassococcus arenae]